MCPEPDDHHGRPRPSVVPGKLAGSFDAAIRTEGRASLRHRGVVDGLSSPTTPGDRRRAAQGSTAGSPPLLGDPGPMQPLVADPASSSSLGDAGGQGR